VAASLVVVGLTVVVVSLGFNPFPPDRSPLKLRWEFTNPETQLWSSLNGEVQQTPRGLVLSPNQKPAVLTSGWFKRPVKSLGRARMSLSVQEPSEGRLEVIFDSPSGAQQHHVFPFHSSRGGGGFEDIVIPLTSESASNDPVKAVVLLPSVVPQTVVVASVVLEPNASWLGTAVMELLSPLPGELMARQGYSINRLSPPVINGRSAWMVLIPIVLLAGALARGLHGNTEITKRIRRYAWGLIGTVWVLSFALLIYHQAIAMAYDTQTYGGIERDDAYQAWDGIPLAQDLLEATQFIPSRTPVEFDSVEEHETSQTSFNRKFWKGRAAYYLLPTLVRPGAPIRIQYFIGSHPPCDQVEPENIVLHEAIRFCLFQTQK